MKVNLYSGLDRNERKILDRELLARMMPKMVYMTSRVVPHKNLVGIVQNLPIPENIDPKTGKTAPFSGVVI